MLCGNSNAGAVVIVTSMHEFKLGGNTSVCVCVCLCVWSGVFPSRWICMFLTIKEKEKRN